MIFFEIFPSKPCSSENRNIFFANLSIFEIAHLVRLFKKLNLNLYFELEIGMLNRLIFNTYTYIFNQHIYDTRYQCMFHWLSVARLQHQNLFIESTDVYSATAHSVPEIII